MVTNQSAQKTFAEMQKHDDVLVGRDAIYKKICIQGQIGQV